VQEIYDKIARTDVGLAEPRIPVQSLPGSATALHVISQPGSYYLTGNIEGVAGKNGIEIRTSNVTLDLYGHTLIGNGGVNGVVCDQGAGNVRVHNGHSTGWSQWGIDLQGLDGNGWRTAVEDVHADFNGSGGIRVRYGRVARCFTWGNSNNGIEAFITVIEDCICVANTSNGIWAGFSSTVQRCSCTGNGDGYFIYGGASLLDSVADNNIGTGIGVGHECLVAGCVTRLNERGIYIVNDKNRIERNNVVSASAHGILVGGVNNIVLSNTVRGDGGAYSINPGNSNGPIVNVAGVGDITSVPNANHPWANFIY